MVSEASDLLLEQPGSQLPFTQTKTSLNSRMRESLVGFWCPEQGRRPVDMFRQHSSRGTGPGKGPSLSHSCWIYQRGIVQKRSREPEARAQGSGYPETSFSPLLPAFQSPAELLFLAYSSRRQACIVTRCQGRA